MQCTCITLLQVSDVSETEPSLNNSNCFKSSSSKKTKQQQEGWWERW